MVRLGEEEAKMSLDTNAFKSKHVKSRTLQPRHWPPKEGKAVLNYFGKMEVEW